MISPAKCIVIRIVFDDLENVLHLALTLNKINKSVRQKLVLIFSFVIMCYEAPSACTSGSYGPCLRIL